MARASSSCAACASAASPRRRPRFNFWQGKSTSSSGEELAQDIVAGFGAHLSFVTSPLPVLAQLGQDAKMPLFGLKHCAGSCTYDADTLDPALVAKLFSDPGLAAQSHPKDSATVVQTQVVGRPLRDGTDAGEDGYAELYPSKVYSVDTQLNTAGHARRDARVDGGPGVSGCERLSASSRLCYGCEEKGTRTASLCKSLGLGLRARGALPRRERKHQGTTGSLQ